MKLHELKAPKGATKKRKRIGRGPGSGHGKTATKGHKGLLARSGGGKRPGFEGGQMPLIRKIPKYGFTNPFRTRYAVVNVKALAALNVDQVSPEVLVGARLIKGSDRLVKVLGDGDLRKPIVVQAHKFS